jgi:chromate transporter
MTSSEKASGTNRATNPTAKSGTNSGTTTGTGRGSLLEVSVVFLKLGLLAYGGTAGLVAMMRREIVEKHRWTSEQEFLDLLGICSLLPGPTAAEMAIALGYERAGWPALFLGGGLFILPAIVMVVALAWAYVRFGMLPASQWILYGAVPIVIAIIVDALWGLGRAAIKNVWLAALSVVVILLYFRGVSVVATILGAGILSGVVAFANWKKTRTKTLALPAPMKMAAHLFQVAATAPIAGAIPFSLARLFLTFLKIGAVCYGGGYALIAFLRADFVVHLGWLTDRQLLDAITIAQITPGPIFAASSFIGYLKGGVMGALLATLGIFLPSFVFIAIVFPVIPILKRSAAAHIVLDGINAATVGLMAAVSWQLARDAIFDATTAAEAIIAFFLLRRYKLNSAWLILGGIVIGVAVKMAAK